MNAKSLTAVRASSNLYRGGRKMARARRPVDDGIDALPAHEKPDKRRQNDDPVWHGRKRHANQADDGQDVGDVHCVSSTART